MVLIPDNTEISDQIDEGPEQLGISYPNAGHPDDGKKKNRAQ